MTPPDVLVPVRGPDALLTNYWFSFFSPPVFAPPMRDLVASEKDPAEWTLSCYSPRLFNISFCRQTSQVKASFFPNGWMCLSGEKELLEGSLVGFFFFFRTPFLPFS